MTHDGDDGESQEIRDLIATVRAEMVALEGKGRKPWAVMTSERILPMCLPELRARAEDQDGRALHLRDDEARLVVYRVLRRDLGRIPPEPILREAIRIWRLEAGEARRLTAGDAGRWASIFAATCRVAAGERVRKADMYDVLHRVGGLTDLEIGDFVRWMQNERGVVGRHLKVGGNFHEGITLVTRVTPITEDGAGPSDDDPPVTPVTPVTQVEPGVATPVHPGLEDEPTPSDNDSPGTLVTPVTSLQRSSISPVMPVTPITPSEVTPTTSVSDVASDTPEGQSDPRQMVPTNSAPPPAVHKPTRLVVVPSIQHPITKSPGFSKKQLSEHKLDIMALCGFGCSYCSSNAGNYLRINRERFADLTEQQLGERLYPATSPELAMIWADVLKRLEDQVRGQPKDWGNGQTLVFSMLTDAFSGPPLHAGTTEQALRIVLEGTSFRIRVLTKNSAVGTPQWIRVWRQYPDRFIVGLSTGSLDDAWARRVEIGTPPPSARLRATQALQAAGIPTFGMLCPIFPDVLALGQVDDLVDAINPASCEEVWAEPFNDRVNWKLVRDGYQKGSPGWIAMTEMFETNAGAWSRYATDLFLILRVKAEREGWLGKLHYLLYEHHITTADAARFGSLEGVLLQSKPDGSGFSQHPVFAQMQRQAANSGQPVNVAGLTLRSTASSVIPIISAPEN